MARMRTTSLAALAIGALVGALGVAGTSAAPPVRADATAVIHWNEVAANTLAAIPGPNGGAPPALQINMGMVQGAVYDAVNAIGPRAAPAVPAQEALWCEGVDRRRGRNGRVRRVDGHRLERAGAGLRSRPRTAC